MRLHVNINPETAAVFRRFKRRGQSATETVRRAVSLYWYLTRAQRAGKHIELVDRDGTITRVVFP